MSDFETDNAPNEPEEIATPADQIDDSVVKQAIEDFLDAPAREDVEPDNEGLIDVTTSLGDVLSGIRSLSNAPDGAYADPLDILAADSELLDYEEAQRDPNWNERQLCLRAHDGVKQMLEGHRKEYLYELSISEEGTQRSSELGARIVRLIKLKLDIEVRLDELPPQPS